MKPRDFLLALLLLSTCAARGSAGDAGQPTTDASAETTDSGEPAADPSLTESLDRQREDRLMRARAFEARAQLERDLAAKQKKSDVKQQLIEAANRLAAQAAEERRLAGEAQAP